MWFKFENSNLELKLSDECVSHRHGFYPFYIDRVVNSHDDKLFEAITWCILNDIEPFMDQSKVTIYQLNEGCVHEPENFILKFTSGWKQIEMVEFKRFVYNTFLENLPNQYVSLYDLKKLSGGDLIIEEPHPGNKVDMSLLKKLSGGDEFYKRNHEN